jgi:Ni,Fe-hydrogenase III large subunit
VFGKIEKCYGAIRKYVKEISPGEGIGRYESPRGEVSLC